MRTIICLILIMFWANFPALGAQEIDLRLTRVSQRDQIVDISNAGDGSGRLFLVEQPGRIFIIEYGVEFSEPFLDIRQKVRSAGNEQGLLSLAFAPDFEASGAFYVWYTNPFGDTVLERYFISPDPDLADESSGEVILVVQQPFSNHNGGRLRFGPDGMLYLGLGDGGGAFDPEGNGQLGTTLLGKLIRIDADPVHGTYEIPPDNPFAQQDSILDEIWALGLRNPWRISFDSLTGDLYIADVGQDELEEVNFQAAGSAGGENYGWAIMEGSRCRAAGCDQSGLTLPVAEYEQIPHCAVTGGEVYRGDAYPDLFGLYLFGDFCSGTIWGLNQDGSQWETRQLLDSNLLISTFGLDEAGNIYVADLGTGVYLLSDGPVVPEPQFTINSGLNDAWFNPATPGQGFFITVFPDIEGVFLAWFTYDTVRPPEDVQALLGEPGHRWRTAFGPYDGDTAILDVELTRGGVFDLAQPKPVQEADGSIALEFDDCNAGRVIYEISSTGDTGVIPIQRIAADNIAACEARLATMNTGQ